ncbi:hypothetical protein IFM89_004551 [Coptis chinensis]|uniref:Peptidase M1 membrane alanine aminopeptidase domain-containing protein n=1 Tax=Coptis chinensis TaxID=261450 RepID=A0A835H4A8_9MAGN|nr:hypothetical protein IFM89_004551 [Coptis chinensis]
MFLGGPIQETLLLVRVCISCFGKLESTDETFVTHSVRKVSRGSGHRTRSANKGHAMYSLKAAMRWDEDVFGLEYDLDIFNIVAVPDYDMGAMENKSLNVQTASDADYTDILEVIGHEYFHNWTGNRLAHFLHFTQHT